METRFLLILSISVFAVGMAAGFYLSNALQNQLSVLIGAAIVLAFLTWLGSGADFLGLLREWYKEKKEANKTPIFTFDGFYKNSEDAYFVRVRKAKGEGMPICVGFLSIEGTDMIMSATVWEHAALREYKLGGKMGLRLFRLLFDTYRHQIIIFPAANAEQGFADNARNFDEYKDKELQIELQAERGITPDPILIKIKDIVKMVNNSQQLGT